MKDEPEGEKKPTGIMVAIGGPSKEMGAKPPDSSMPGGVSESDMALQDAFDAVKSGDVESFKLALRTAIEACMEEYGGGMGMK